ncbi:Elongation factor Ts, mitochondrial [Abortiporus biennis]
MFSTIRIQRTPAFHSTFHRLYSSAPDSKVPIKLVAELRKLTSVSLSKAREALTASNHDVQGALAWLSQDLSATGAKKSDKVKDRTANEGLIGVSILSKGLFSDQAGNGGKGIAGRGVRGAIVELNCETDFVARNELFGQLVQDIAHTCAFVSEIAPSPSSPASSLIHSYPLELLENAPLLSSVGASHHTSSGNYKSVIQAIQEVIAKVGEKIVLRRASNIVQPSPPSSTPSGLDLGLRLSTYSHGSLKIPTQGRISALSVLALKSPRLASFQSNPQFCADLEKLEKSLNMQIVGFPTKTVRGQGEEGSVLYEQPFDMFAQSEGRNIEDTLRAWALEKGLIENLNEEGGIEVLEFAKWSVGEDLD